MGALMAGIGSLTGWPSSIFVLQALAYWTAIGVLVFLYSEECASRSRAVGLLLLTGFFPPAWAQVGILWKDVHLMLALLWSFAFLGLLHRGVMIRYRAVWATAFITVSLYGISVRHNGMPAFLPVFFAFLDGCSRLACISERVTGRGVGDGGRALRNF